MSPLFHSNQDWFDYLTLLLLEHFPKPYTRAEKKMLALEDTLIDETSDSESSGENGEGEETKTAANTATKKQQQLRSDKS